MTDCIVNGRLVAADEASIPIQDRGFRYGDGVFETVAVHLGVPYRYDWHVERLQRGLRAIKISFDVSEIKDYCRQLIHQNKLNHGLLRIQVTRGIGSRGYLPDPTHPQARANFVIETAPMPIMPDKAVNLWQSSYAKVSDTSLPVQYKLCQGLNSTLARIEAQEKNCFDALLLNDKGHLCETSSGNLFWLQEGRLYTPSLECGVLEGVARHAVMQLSPYPVVEVKTGIAALKEAEAVFITNVLWKSIAVEALLPQRMRWHSDEAAQNIRQMLNDDRESYCTKHQSQW